jgi:hypothetical protein
MDGVNLVRTAFEAAASRARWPMYVRNVKQLLRGIEGGFDERRYGFNGIIDLLRACQRDGIFRLERDRQGVLRVFPGPALQRPQAMPHPEPAVEVPHPVVPEVVAEPETAPVVVEAEVLAESVAVEEPGVQAHEVEAAEPIAEESEPAGEATPGEEAPAKPSRRRRTSAGGARKSAGPKKPRATRARRTAKAS